MRLEQDPVHTHKDVLAHTIAVIRNTRPELVVRLAALFHDVGKPKTRLRGGAVSLHHHEVVGARMAEERLRALRYPNDVIEDVTQLVYLHLRIHTYAMGWTDKAVRRYATCGPSSTSSTTCSGPTARPATRSVRTRWRGGWTSLRRASRRSASRRRSTRSVRRSTGAR